MMKIGIYALVGAILLSGIPCFAAESDSGSEILSIGGEVQEIDAVKSVLAVKPSEGTQNMLIFKVPDGVAVTRGSDSIMFDDIDVGDNVNIQYTEDVPGARTVVSIEDNNLGNE